MVKIRKHTAKEIQEKSDNNDRIEREFWIKNSVDVEFFIDDLAKDAMLIFKLNGVPVKYSIFRDIYKLANSDKEIDNLIKWEFVVIKEVLPFKYTQPIPNFYETKKKFQSGKL